MTTTRPVGEGRAVRHKYSSLILGFVFLSFFSILKSKILAADQRKGFAAVPITRASTGASVSAFALTLASVFNANAKSASVETRAKRKRTHVKIF